MLQMVPIITEQEFESIKLYATRDDKKELLKLIKLALNKRLFSSEQLPIAVKIVKNYIDYPIPDKVEHSYNSLNNSIKTKLFLNSFSAFENKLNYKIESNSIVLRDFMSEVDKLKQEVSIYTSNNKSYSDEAKLLDFNKLDVLSEQYNSQIKNYLPSSYKSLDNILSGGFRKTRLYMFVGSTGVGKSTLLRNLGWNLIHSGHNVLHVTLEMTSLETLVGYIPLITRVPLDEIISNDIVNYSTEIKNKLSKRLQIAEFLANEQVSDLKNLMLILKTKPDVLIIDYLDMLTPSSDWTEVASMMQELKNIATQYNIAILTAAQFNRGAEESSGEQFHIAGSYDKVKKAETVILLRQSYQDKMSNILKLFVSKNRWGKSNVSLPLKINYEYLKLYEPKDEREQNI